MSDVAAITPVIESPPAAAGDPPPAGELLLEEGRRFSDSIIWKLQRAFYTRHGPKAWRQAMVPSYVTSNPFIARAYAEVILGFLRDCAAQGGDPAQPVTIIEVAAGSGRFSYHLLRALDEVRSASPFSALKVRYVMTDLAPANVAAWQTHPLFQPFIEAGWLDFAHFDAEQDAQLQLLRSGEALTPGSLRNPLLVIANYAFDTFPQDVFRVEHGRLHLGRATTYSSQAAEPDLDDPGILTRSRTQVFYEPVEGQVYSDGNLNQILAQYHQRLNEVNLIIPVAAIDCLRRLAALSAGGMLLLSADKGYDSETELSRGNGEYIALHGSISMMVNYHALAQYFQRQGGVAMLPARRTGSIKITAFWLGRQAIPETRLAYQRHMQSFSPDDLFQLLNQLEKALTDPPLELIVNLLRLTGWDPDILLRYTKPVLEHAAKASDADKAQLRQMVERIWENFFPLASDVPFELGRLCYAVDRPREALRYYEHSLQMYGEHPITIFNMALCAYHLEQPEEALRQVQRSLELDPDYSPARAWRIRLESELGIAPA